MLVIDDGELDHVVEALERIGADFVRISDPPQEAIAWPTDVLVTTCKRARDLEPSGERAGPVWICFDHQDFLPLRERLRSAGVHYLAHTEIAPEPLRLLLLQALYTGGERRSTRRLPVGCEVAWASGGQPRKGILVELSPESARLIVTEPLPCGADVTLCPPSELGMGRIELSGHSIRCTAWQPEDRRPGYQLVIAFDELEVEPRERLEAFCSGRQRGSPVTTLCGPPQRSSAEAVDESDIDRERRSAPRRRYDRRVPTLAVGPADPEIVLGYDLSLTGMRIARELSYEVGSRLRVALHGHAREEPIVLDAMIVRDDGSEGFGLLFVGVSPEKERQLQKLLGQLPPLEALCDEELRGRGLVISRLLR